MYSHYSVWCSGGVIPNGLTIIIGNFDLETDEKSWWTTRQGWTYTKQYVHWSENGWFLGGRTSSACRKECRRDEARREKKFNWSRRYAIGGPRAQKYSNDCFATDLNSILLDCIDMIQMLSQTSKFLTFPRITSKHRIASKHWIIKHSYMPHQTLGMTTAIQKKQEQDRPNKKFIVPA